MLSEKYEAEVESGAKPLKVAKKYGVLTNTISTWLLPGKLKFFLNLVRLAQKENT